MFGKKNETAKPATDQKGLASASADLGQGELILEQLFMEERPESKTSKFAALAEEAEFVEVKPATALTEEKKVSRVKVADSGLFSVLFKKSGKSARKEKQRKEAEQAVTAETPNLEEGTLETPLSAEIAEPAASPESAEKSEPSKPAEPAKRAKAKATKKTAKSKRRGCRDVYLSVQIAGDRSVFWKLTAQGIEPVKTLPDGCHTLSFSKEDLRFEVEKRISYSAAQTLVLQEVGDAVHLLNRSKDLRAVYATLRSHIEGLSYRLGPGQLLLDHLVRQRAPDAEALIVGAELKDRSGRDALLILYYLSASGRLSEPQISVYPDNRDFLLSQFAASTQASHENAQVLLFDHAILFDAASHAEFYPNEPHIGGIPLRKVWHHAAGVGVVAAALSLGWAYQNLTQYDHARASIARVQSSIELSKRTMSDLLSGSPRALARALTLDVQQILNRSHELWVPGSRIQMTADGTGVDYHVTLPLLQVRAGASQVSVADANARAVEALLHLKTPDGCERGTLNFSGTFHEAQLNFRCEAAPHPLDRYRGG